MRAPRAYLAGFGTSGSLLAGAALLFILASAFIGFHGWPSMGNSPSTVAVSVPRAPLGTATSRASRVLATTTAPQVSGTAAHNGTLGPAGAGRAGGTVHAGTVGPSGGTHAGLTNPGGGPTSLTGHPASTPGGGTGPAPSHCPAAGCTTTPPIHVPAPVTAPVHRAQGAVHKVVTTVTGHLPGSSPGSGGNSSPSTVVHRVTSGAGSTVHHVVSGAGSTVHHVVSGAGSTIHHVIP